MKTYEKIYNLVKKIPKGKVATYGQIGQFLNLDPRVIGWALNRLARYNMSLRAKRSNPDRIYKKRSGLRSLPRAKRRGRYAPRNDKSIPWQRVINSKGKISTNRVMNIPLGLQKKLLEKEGIKFDKNEKINLKKHLFKLRFSYN